MTDACTRWAGRSQAKLNLSLRVHPVRGDGFHPIESLFTTISLSDDVVVEVGPARGDEPVVRCECDEPGIPTDERNLAVRAAALLRTAAQKHDDLAITLRKRIPTGAGLGGGSSNAATVLRALAEIWGWPRTAAELSERGATLGSDVPLFLGPTQGYATGRGERITPIASGIRGCAVVVLPELHCATADVYRAFDALPPPPARPGRAVLESLLSESAQLMDALFNDLEPAAERVVPAVGALRRKLEQLAGGAVRMTGSGAAHFRLFADDAAATHFARRVRDAVGVRSEVVRLGVGIGDD